ncbi:hypothetical protein Q5692_38955 [Microcoleus sp. C2C3]|uniref:hypothetical protein n=1 Tax=unclassified Microcoleus TaxID=2642155 RepID=UPI002FCF4FC3
MLKRKRLPHRQRYKSRPSRNLYRFRLHGHDRVKVNNSTFLDGRRTTPDSRLPIIPKLILAPPHWQQRQQLSFAPPS